MSKSLVWLMVTLRLSFSPRLMLLIAMDSSAQVLVPLLSPPYSIAHAPKATLVEGSDYASLTYVAPDPSAALTIGYACSIDSGVAVCSGEAAGATILETETVSAFGVEGGATETAAGTVATGSSSTLKAGSSSTAKTGSGSSSGTAASTGTSSGSAASSTQSNSSSAISASSKIVMGAMGVLLGLVSVL